MTVESAVLTSEALLSLFSLSTAVTNILYVEFLDGVSYVKLYWLKLWLKSMDALKMLFM